MTISSRAQRKPAQNKSPLKMHGKRVLVPGSGTGLGREIALEFARQGADVVLHYSHAQAGALTARDEIRALGRRCEVFHADFSDPEQSVSLGERAIVSLAGLTA